jgi:hypothetical protein
VSACLLPRVSAVSGAGVACQQELAQQWSCELIAPHVNTQQLPDSAACLTPGHCCQAQNACWRHAIPMKSCCYAVSRLADQASNTGIMFWNP